MSEYLIQETDLISLADAVREKTGGTESLSFDDIVSEIAGISTGVELNFDVVGGTTQPTNPTENMIWVNTDTDITSYTFSETQPSDATEGMVWMAVGIGSPAPFCAIENNPIMLYPLNAKQYINGVWTDRITKIYQNDNWSELIIYLFYYGDKKEGITGGWTAQALPMYRSSSGAGVAASSPTVTTQSNGGVKLGVSYSSGIYRTTNKIDLTNIKTIKLNGTIYGNNSGNANWAGMYVWSGLGNLYVDNVVAHVNSKQTTVSNPTLDVSGLSGEYYIGFGLYDTGSASYVIMNYLQLLN